MADITDLRSLGNQLRADKTLNYDGWRNSNLEVANVLMRHASIYDAHVNNIATMNNTIEDQIRQITQLTASEQVLLQENEQLKLTLNVTQQWLETEKLKYKG